MPAMIQRLETKNGIVYDMSQPWPGAPVETDESRKFLQLKVGPIFFLPGEEDTLEDEEGNPVAITTSPPRYEIWCVTDRTLAAFVGQLKGIQIPKDELEYILTQAGMTRRIVFLDSVSAVDEDWPASHAFPKLISRFIDLGKEAEEESKQESAVDVPSTAVAGNGAQTTQA